MAGPLRGGGVKGRAIEGKNNFFWNLFFPTFQPTDIMLEGGRPLIEEFFWGFPRKVFKGRG